MKFIVTYTGVPPGRKIRCPVRFSRSRFPCADLCHEEDASRFDTVQAATEAAANHWTAEQFTVEPINK